MSLVTLFHLLQNLHGLNYLHWIPPDTKVSKETNIIITTHMLKLNLTDEDPSCSMMKWGVCESSKTRRAFICWFCFGETFLFCVSTPAVCAMWHLLSLWNRCIRETAHTVNDQSKMSSKYMFKDNWQHMLLSVRRHAFWEKFVFQQSESKCKKLWHMKVKLGYISEYLQLGLSCATCDSKHIAAGTLGSALESFLLKCQEQSQYKRLESRLRENSLSKSKIK